VTGPDRPTWTLSALSHQQLRRTKAERGVSIAVVIPALDEGATVAAVVEALRPLLAPAEDAHRAGRGGTDRTLPPLLDELVVVDGGSDDDTVAQAEAAGARVVVQREHTDARGKGAALWAGVRATEADLIAFVDADVLDPHAGLVTGPLAPLLLDDRLRLVKANYRRPFEDAPSGGGRVTELLVRPLLALCWPALADLGQPLAGEYAADRTLLESLPFEQGYGVELGLLIDTLRWHGRGAIAQVDLGTRAHTHQTLDELGRMAGELLLVAADRLAAEGRALPTPDELRLPQADVRRRVMPPISAGPSR
jgi:glucosyl-3-phosphoglycerate synthase